MVEVYSQESAILSQIPETKKYMQVTPTKTKKDYILAPKEKVFLTCSENTLKKNASRGRTEGWGRQEGER